MNEDKAPTCPINYDQEPTDPRGFRGTAPIRLPSIPTATDLPSLIRSVNIMRDILRTLTTSLTVNNFYGGKVTPSRQYGKKDYLMSNYFSDWYQTKIEPKEGIIYNKSGKKINRKMKAYINRIDAVHLRNNARDNSQILLWRYPKKPDAVGTGDPVFEEDYFERIVNVKWGPTGKTGPSGPSGPTRPPPQYTDLITVMGWGGFGGPSPFGPSREQAIAIVEGLAAAWPEVTVWGVFDHNMAYTLTGLPADAFVANLHYEPWSQSFPYTWNVIYCYVGITGVRGTTIAGFSIVPG